jgi:hypothetical protein
VVISAGVVSAADTPVVATAGLNTANLQEDFPAMCLDRDGTAWVVYIENDSQADTLKIARKTDTGLVTIGVLAEPGIIHRPAIACDGKGTVWAIWSELDDKNAWELNARAIVDGKIAAETVTIEGASGSAIFPDAGSDAAGRVWVVWQSFRKSLGDIFAIVYDPASGKWSEEIQVTTNPAGDWEPQLAFAGDAAWIVFDSSRGDDEFNVYLAKVTADGKSKITPVTSSPRFEGRASIAATPDGKALWLAWENGRLLWGKDSRGVGGTIGLNGNKRIDVAHVDVATCKVTLAADVTPVLKRVAKPKPAAGKKQPPKKKPAGGGVQALNLPQIVVDAGGNPWLATRRCNGIHWKIALTKYNPKQKTWTQPVVLANSSFGQDRRCHAARDTDGKLIFAWPSDLRTTKKALFSGVYLAQVDPTIELALAAVPAAKAAVPKELPAKWGGDTPDRPRADRHTWTAEGTTYGLYWGDFHRHTDISNCRTAHDGCIVDQFRYAYDVGKLDMLGTSDHTDVGKPYDPYEWWCNQKLADVFYVPEFFNSMYVYEREQRWPWGHRNVIFRERGGPIVYINRGLYKSMPWHKKFPVAEGAAEIHPEELWKILRQNGQDVTIISHTGATGMGTDWDGYKQIDNAVENLVEIYQGARVSYEGIGTPQPQVGFPKGKQLKEDAHGSVKTGKDFGQYNKGVYQNCLKNGWKLGVFANSDHISTHTTFGGVYARSFTREDLLAGLNARRTIAATDKIFMEFSCNGRLLGEIFDTTEKPAMKVSVRGTALLKAVTIIRNEADIRRFTPKDTKDFDGAFTDEEPVVGENRYYVRVEQVDGNMGWTSPVWVTYKK